MCFFDVFLTRNNPYQSSISSIIWLSASDTTQEVNYAYEAFDAFWEYALIYRKQRDNLKKDTSNTEIGDFQGPPEKEWIDENP